MKTLYLDIFSGISGDMFIGAMLDLGVPFHELEHQLKGLGLDEYHLHSKRASKCAIEGVKFDVHLSDHGVGHDHHHHHDDDHDDHHHHSHDDGHHHDHGDHHHHGHSHEQGHSHGHGHSHSHDDHDHHHHHDDHHHHDHGHEHHHGRGFKEIRELILTSRLSPWVREKSVAVFERIARAEGRIHGKPVEEVHFHEVGAVDSIVDVVGACICLELLGKPKVEAGPVVDGFGWIDCAHGRFPIPAPATLEIFSQRGIAVSQTDEPQELITPTGAAILTEFVEHFGPMRGLQIERIGFGLGTRDNKTRPNVLRAALGTSANDSSGGVRDWEVDQVALVEANLDDINAEILGHFVERALKEGALDVFYTPIQMKKNRPGVLLSVLCSASDKDRFAELVLRETSSFGVRLSLCERRKLQREQVTVQTPFGPVLVKVGTLGGKRIQNAPEFESCKAIAEKAGQPVKVVYEAAVRAAAGN